MRLLYFIIVTTIFDATPSLIAPIVRTMFNPKIVRLRDFELGYNKVTGHDAITTISALLGMRVTPDPPAAYPVAVPVRLKPVSIEDVQHFIHFSAASYCEPKLLMRFNCDECKLTGQHTKLIQVMRNASLDTQSYVAINHVRRDIIVTFRGTYNPTNLRSDFWLKRIMSPLGDGAKLHDGFYRATMSLYQQVSHFLLQTRKLYPNYRVVVTGHSLGGSMATMTYYFLSHYMPELNYALITYGAPRGGDQRYADIINSKSVPCARVVNGLDLAPHLVAWSEGYFHHGNEYWITNGKIRVCSNEVYEDTTCSASLPRQKLIGADHFEYLGASTTLFSCIDESPIAGIFGILTG